MDEQTVKKLLEVMDATAEYKALLMIYSYVRQVLPDEVIADLAVQRRDAYQTMREGRAELERLLTLQAPA